ncbi:MAG: helix-turn-helix domain-containing protein [Clostridia bacterium]|nr:helix-turn-helix domain-containing protein [Clostridia bacterium]
MAMILGKEARMTLDEPEKMAEICHALSSPVRVKIMRLLTSESKSVGEIAEEMDLPMSSAALAVQVLQKAGLIITKTQPGTRGTMKLCSRKLDLVQINLAPPDNTPSRSLTFSMPIGGYSAAENIVPTCGLASANSLIGMMDAPSVFYLPGRFAAQLIWLQQGFLEYRFSTDTLEYRNIEWIEVSFEACSEAPMYRDPWKSDIAVEINGKRLGIWTSPCDCGGRRGLLTPEWWSETSTQFGFQKLWRVDRDGSYLDNQRISNVKLEDLEMDRSEYISVRIGVPADAEYVGGLNLFGEQFGDYAQSLMLRVGYTLE